MPSPNAGDHTEAVEPRPRLVIAEGDPVDRAMLREYLESEEMEVLSEAGDGAEAVSLVLRDHPDVVVMDVRMPSVDGLRAASRIHVASPDTQVVLLSSEPSEDVAHDAEGLGVYLVIDKDEPTLIIDAVKGAVALKRSGPSSG